MSDQPNGNGGRDKLRAAADNTWALVFARFFMPAALAAIGSLLLLVLHNVENSIIEVKQASERTSATIWTAIQHANDSAASIHESVQVLFSKFDSDQAARNSEISVIKAQLIDHEARIRVIERGPH
jgi:hypothetical protein